MKQLRQSRLTAFHFAILLLFQFVAACGRNEHTTPPPKAADIPTLVAGAEKGDVRAQVELGKLYVLGQGMTNSYSEAAKWFRRAADKGDAEAQARLGELYEAGRGVAKNQEEAMRYYQMAAAQGNATAQYTLGFLYESGRGVKQDQIEAAKWYKLAAEQGEPLAQFDLAQRYEIGVGVKTDKVEALKWFILAANQGQADAAVRRDRLKGDLSRQQIGEAHQRVASFSPAKAAPQP